MILKTRLRDLPSPLLAGAAILMTLIMVAVISMVWTPHDPAAINVGKRLASPGTSGYLLGTDRLGRDVASQIMAGSRNSLQVSILSTIGALVGGVTLGLIAAGARRGVQEVLNRIIDVGIVLPAILVGLVLATVLGIGQTTVIVAIIAGFVPPTARVVVGPARQILARGYIEAAFAYGRTRRFVLFRHVLPNLTSLIIVHAAITFAGALMAEAALSFLGLGAQPPTQSWGRLLQESQAVVGDAPSLVLFPGLAITFAVLGFMLIGNGLHSLLDLERREWDAQPGSQTMAV